MFNVGALDVDMPLLLKLFFRDAGNVGKLLGDMDGEIDVWIVVAAAPSSSAAAEAGGKTPNFMSPNCAAFKKCSC